MIVVWSAWHHRTHALLMAISTAYACATIRPNRFRRHAGGAVLENARGRRRVHDELVAGQVAELTNEVEKTLKAQEEAALLREELKVRPWWS
jgi:hypothetical protein